MCVILYRVELQGELDYTCIISLHPGTLFKQTTFTESERKRQPALIYSLQLLLVLWSCCCMLCIYGLFLKLERGEDIRERHSLI